jgi:hypothetical protein
MRGFSSKASSSNVSSFCSVLFVFFACELMFFRPRAELEPSAAQTFESVDETFCQADVPSLRRVLST